jgi:hypothetical protein
MLGYSWHEALALCSISLLLGACIATVLIMRDRGQNRQNIDMYEKLRVEHERLLELLHRRTIEMSILREALEKYRLRKKSQKSQLS